MQPVTDQLLQDIVDRLVEALHPQAIYLFGSHASGKAHPRSDVDLLVVVDDDAGDTHELAGRGYLILPHTAVDVDLLVFHRRSMEKWAPVRFSIQNEATHKGKLIYAA